MQTDRTLAPPGHASDAAAGPAALDAAKVEALLLNLDASLRVHARAQFFKWTQGLLQSVIPHEVLICALRAADTRSFRVDSFATAAPQGALFGELFLRDGTAVPGLLNEWRECGCLPITCVARHGGALCGGEFARELEEIGATELVAHGICDADGQAASFFVFCCRPGTAGALQRYLVQLALPALQTAWIRAQTGGGHAAGGERPAPADVGVLTPREREILRWVAIGKSNFEVGAILHISPLTVKNHMQKILRKMNVVNRTQAVGKALESRIIAP